MSSQKKNFQKTLATHFVTTSENVTAGRKCERFFNVFGGFDLLFNISKIALFSINRIEEDAFCAKYCSNRLRDD